MKLDDRELAHSVTLALAALKVVVLPVPPIEAAIALSVLFLATEITRGKRESITWNYPIAVSGSFGLLHGLGAHLTLTLVALGLIPIWTFYLLGFPSLWHNWEW